MVLNGKRKISALFETFDALGGVKQSHKLIKAANLSQALEAARKKTFRTHLLLLFRRHFTRELGLTQALVVPINFPIFSFKVKT